VASSAMVWQLSIVCFQYHKLCTGFIQTLESPVIRTLRFPGLESSGKKALVLENPGKVLEF